MMITKLHLTPNEWSRPQRKISTIKAVVLHWVANPGTSAKANRDFFESRKHGKLGYGSAHYIIDDTMIIECIPTDEMAYHVGSDIYTKFAKGWLGPHPNHHTLGVELCHPDWTGEFSENTWHRAVRFVADLLLANTLDAYQITTHHNITGKDCPRWFVDNPSELDRFRWDVASHMRTAV